MNTCIECNKEVSRTIYLKKYDNRVCKDCLDNEYSSCEDCGLKTITGDLILIKGSDKLVCDVCLNTGDYRWCISCEEYHDTESRGLHGGDSICDRCYEDGGFSYCDDCGNLFTDDEVNYHDREDCYYCDNCYPEDSDDEDDDDGNLFSYHSSKGRDNKSEDERYRFGIELEREDVELKENISKYKLLEETGWVVEADGSLGYGGFEAISPILPLNISKLKTAFNNEMVASIINAGYSSACGGHITISDTQRTSEKLINDTWGYYPLLYALYPHRVGNGYCYTTSDVNAYKGKVKQSRVDKRCEARWVREMDELRKFRINNRGRESYIAPSYSDYIIGAYTVTTKPKVKEPIVRNPRYVEYFEIRGGGHCAVSSRAKNNKDDKGTGVEFRIFDAPKNKEDILFRAKILLFMLENPSGTVLTTLKYLSDNTYFNKLIRKYLKFLGMSTKEFTNNIIKFSNEIQKETINNKEIIKLEKN